MAIALLERVQKNFKLKMYTFSEPDIDRLFEPVRSYALCKQKPVYRPYTRTDFSDHIETTQN